MRRLVILIVLILAYPASAQAEKTVIFHCKFSHKRQVDPIVSYGVEPSAHLHDFFGSNATDAFSTADTLEGTSTTCKTAGDTAGYWFPEPIWTYADGRTVHTVTAHLGEYWQRPAGILVAAPPHGMTFVAGNSHAASPGDNAALTWTCANGAVSGRPRNCTNARHGDGYVTARLEFAVCWDGTATFDTPAGIAPAHFTYAPCPTGTTRIAKLVTHTRFIDPRTGKYLVNPYNNAGRLGLSFTSGRYYTYHGDFLNGWSERALAALIDGCLNKRSTCPPHG